MATYQKFEGWVGYLGTKVLDLNADLLEVYLSNAVPSASLDDVKADLAEITIQFGYTGGSDTANAYSEATGTGTLTGTDVTWTASGGSFGPFQYVAMFDETVTTPVVDPLSNWWDYGSALTVNDGESFTVDFGASIATIT